jgi:hypothetical protein
LSLFPTLARFGGALHAGIEINGTPVRVNRPTTSGQCLLRAALRTKIGHPHNVVVVPQSDITTGMASVTGTVFASFYVHQFAVNLLQIVTVSRMIR